MEEFTLLGWALFYLASLFAIWQYASQAVERRTIHKLEGLRRRNETLQSSVTNLEGEIGSLRNQLLRARDEGLRAARNAAEVAARLNRPRVDQFVILGGEELRRDFAPTESMCHV